MNSVLGILTAGLLLLSVAPSGAQTIFAEQRGGDFIREMLSVARTGGRDAVDGYLRDNIDANYVFNTAFQPVRDIITPDQQQELADLMIKVLAYQTVLLSEGMEYGEMRIVGSVEEADGTRVMAIFRDASGENPFFVLVGRDLVDGRLLIRDVGSTLESSAVGDLRYATEALSVGTTDVAIWIESFERALQ